MVGSYFTLSEIQTISSELMVSMPLNSKATQAFEYILKNIVIPPPEPFSSDQHPTMLMSNRPFDKDRNRRRGQKSKDRSSMDWENVRVPTFVPTKIETKEGIEKQINDFRILLNKISSKNYETQRDLIFNKINEIISANEGADLEKVASTIFDIASANKFYSDLYADLYVELINKYEIFDDLLNGLLDKYCESLKNIHYVDHNIDYDGFCNYTKTNDLRKAMASFIVNLMKKGAVEKEKVLVLILSIQKLLREYIDSDNRSNEVDEIIENLFLLLTQSSLSLRSEEKWSSEILPHVDEISKLKSKDCKSLSSRAVFKCMDILDNLNV
jgi:hypothetical protein